MAPVRDLLALVLCCVLAVVWAAYVLARIARHEAVSEADWLILPTGTAAVLGAVNATTAGTAYKPRHRQGGD